MTSQRPGSDRGHRGWNTHPGGRLRRLGTSAPFSGTRFFVRVIVWGFFSSLREMHQVEMVIAPAIKTEGKSWQLAGAR